MQQFLAGFAICLLLVAAGAAVVYLCARRRICATDRRHSQQMEELSRLAGGLAHEIKNPLSIIKVNLKLMQEQSQTMVQACNSLAEQSTEENADYQAQRLKEQLRRSMQKIAVVEKEADRLSGILEDFLRYAGKIELQTERVDVNELLGELLEFYSPQAHCSSIRIRTAFEPEPLYCEIDRAMVKQAILNLLINSQQAMNSGGELMIRTAREKNRAVLQLSDTGCGIAPENTRRIFEPFYSSRSGGSGLGLCLTRKIIEAHHGDIQLTSEPGTGTQFTIKLPLIDNEWHQR